jgi:hypothetical protein
MATRVSHDWAIIRYPSEQGAIVAKLGNRPLIPDEIAEYDGFVIQSAPDASGLADHDVDWSGLSDDEKTLLSQVYPTNPS